MPNTDQRKYPLPSGEVMLNEDVKTIAQAIESIDVDVQRLVDKGEVGASDIQRLNKRMHRAKLNMLLDENIFPV
ncbi:hypothetical protein H10PHJ05_48 [Aeromonas phage HJ05]|nr:hypothetical protein H10PHJ05_48 [Aeromonas phage HJ05]